MFHDFLLLKYFIRCILIAKRSFMLRENISARQTNYACVFLCTSENWIYYALEFLLPIQYIISQYFIFIAHLKKGILRILRTIAILQT